MPLAGVGESAVVLGNLLQVTQEQSLSLVRPDKKKSLCYHPEFVVARNVTDGISIVGSEVFHSCPAERGDCVRVVRVGDQFHYNSSPPGTPRHGEHGEAKDPCISSNSKNGISFVGSINIFPIQIVRLFI